MMVHYLANQWCNWSEEKQFSKGMYAYVCVLVCVHMCACTCVCRGIVRREENWVTKATNITACV